MFYVLLSEYDGSGSKQWQQCWLLLLATLAVVTMVTMLTILATRWLRRFASSLSLMGRITLRCWASWLTWRWSTMVIRLWSDGDQMVIRWSEKPGELVTWLYCIPRYWDYSTAEVNLVLCNTFFSFVIVEFWKLIKLCFYIVWTRWCLLEWFGKLIKNVVLKNSKVLICWILAKKTVRCLRLFSQFK